MKQDDAARRRDPSPSAISYTLTDAERITGLSKATLYRHAKAGRLRLIRVGGRTLACGASLRALVGAAA